VITLILLGISENGERNRAKATRFPVETTTSVTDLIAADRIENGAHPVQGTYLLLKRYVS